jgi:peptidoglycan/LPS O-acetylase OafA/YrhL
MKNRIIEYDIVRFLAITLVFTLHFTSSAIRNLDLILDFDQSYIKYFGFGVKLFFTLSAFLMSYKLDSLDVKPNKYIIRRIKRILPTHVLIFTILFLLAISLKLSPEIIRFISGVFLVDQVFFIDFNIINPIIWSLEVELQFYFIIYVLLLIRKKLDIIIKPFATGVFMLIIFLFFSDLYENRTLLNYSIYFSFGFFLYEIEKKISVVKSLIFDLSFLTSIIAIPFILDSNLSILIKDLLAALFTGIIIFSSIRINFLRKILVNNIILSIGLSSYSFYLLHFAFLEGYLRFVSPIFQFNFYVDYVIIFGLVSFFSYLSYKFVELNKIFK